MRPHRYLLVSDEAWNFVHRIPAEMVPVMHLWTDPRGMNARVIAHEDFHGMGKLHEDRIVRPDGVSMNLDETAKYCSNL